MLFRSLSKMRFKFFFHKSFLAISTKVQNPNDIKSFKEVLLEEEEFSDQAEQKDFLEEFNNFKEFSSADNNPKVETNTLEKRIKQFIENPMNNDSEGKLSETIKLCIKEIMKKWFDDNNVNKQLDNLYIDFMKSLFENRHKLKLRPLIQTLNLIKIIKNNHFLIPNYLFISMESLIYEFAALCLARLDFSNKNIVQMNDFITIILILEINYKPAIEMLKIWFKTLTDKELKSWSWASLANLMRTLSKRVLREYIKGMRTFREDIMSGCERKFNFLEENEDLMEVYCTTLNIMMEFANVHKLYTKNSKLFNHIIDLIISFNKPISLNNTLSLLRALNLMNYIYREKEIFHALEQSSALWSLRDTDLSKLMYFLKILKNLSKPESFKEFTMKKFELEVFLRIRFHYNSFLSEYFMEYLKLFPYNNQDPASVSNYEVLYRKLLNIPVTRKYCIELINIMKLYTLYEFPFRRLLLSYLPLFLKEIKIISILNKITLLKILVKSSSDLLTDLGASSNIVSKIHDPAIKNIQDIIKLYMIDIESKILHVNNIRLLMMLTREAFGAFEKDNYISIRIRELILSRIEVIWNKFKNKPYFFILATRFYFPEENKVNYFLLSKMEDLYEKKKFSQYLFEFNLFSYPTDGQIKFLKRLVKNADMNFLKTNLHTIFTLFSDFNISHLNNIKSEIKEDISQIAETINRVEILECDNQILNVMKFKSYITSLILYELPYKIPLQLILIKYIEILKIWEEEIPKKKNVMDKYILLNQLFSISNLLYLGLYSLPYEEELHGKFIEIMVIFIQKNQNILNDELLELVGNKIISGGFIKNTYSLILIINDNRYRMNIENKDKISEKIFNWLNKALQLLYDKKHDLIYIMSFEFMLKNVEIEARGIFKIPQSIHNILKEVNEEALKTTPIIWKKTLYALKLFIKHNKPNNLNFKSNLTQYQSEIIKLYSIAQDKAGYLSISFLITFLHLFSMMKPLEISLLEDLTKKIINAYKIDILKTSALEICGIFIKDLQYYDKQLLNFIDENLIFFKNDREILLELLKLIELKGESGDLIDKFKEAVKNK